MTAWNADLNTNGIPDAQEVASTVDLDQDGLKDNQQTSIKSVKMEGTSVQIGVSIKGSPTALAVEAVESEDPQQPDAYASGKPRRMPFGLINFKIAVATPGDQTVVKLYFSEAVHPSSKWYKYDPIADTWHDFSAYAVFAADRRSVTVTRGALLNILFHPRQRQLQRLIVQRYTVPSQQMKFRVYRRGIDSGMRFQDFGKASEQGRGLVGIDPLLLEAVEKESVEVGGHDTLFDSTTSQPESNSRLKIYSAFDSLVRVIIAFRTSLPF